MPYNITYIGTKTIKAVLLIWVKYVKCVCLCDTDPIVLEVRRVVEGARGAAAVQVGVVGAVHHLGAAHRHPARRRARPIAPLSLPALLPSPALASALTPALAPALAPTLTPARALAALARTLQDKHT